MTPADFDAFLHRQVLALRRLKYIIESDEFRTLYELANVQAQMDVAKLITTLDVDGVQDWITDHKVLDLSKCSVIELRQAARRVSIADYNLLTKTQLIEALEDARSKGIYFRIG